MASIERAHLVPARPPQPKLAELRCIACGYGVSVRIAPGRCPMCGGSVWEHATPRS